MNKPHILALDQKENAKHGETLFPMQKYITRLAADYPVVSMHWHEEAELTLITKGDCTYQIDFVTYEAKKGDILFVPPLLLHSISRRTSDEFFSETYVFHMNFLGGNTADICSTRYLILLMNQEFSLPCLITPEHPAYVSLRKIFRQITSLYNDAVIGYELALKSLFLQAIFLLLQYRTECTSPENRISSDKLKQVLDYIELHYAEAITISELAKLCYFSDYYFMRFFKKHMHMTCMEYINSLRLEKSVELFEKGASSILDVSLSVGFRNLSYFHRAFKKKYQMTPLSFIKELKKNDTTDIP